MKKALKSIFGTDGWLRRHLSNILFLFCVGWLVTKFSTFFPEFMRTWLSPLAMCSLVSLVFLVGLYMGGRAILRIMKEEKHFDGWEAAVGITEESMHKVKEEMEQDEHLRKYMFCSRLSTMLTSMKQETENSERERVLPSLTALHDISLRAELSRWDSSGVMTIVSSLLILGIFGTLSGVHKVLSEPGGVQYGLGTLSQALEPSAIAVFGTVILIILHAIYRNKVESLVAKLDVYTLNKLIPTLLPKEKKLDFETLGKIVETLPQPELSIDESRRSSYDHTSTENMLESIACAPPQQVILQIDYELPQITSSPTEPRKLMVVSPLLSDLHDRIEKNKTRIAALDTRIQAKLAAASQPTTKQYDEE